MRITEFTTPYPVWVSGRTYKVGDVVRAPGNWYFTYVRINPGAGATDPFSDPGNWKSDGARPIKAIQRGVTSIPGGSIYVDVTVASTVLGVSEVRFLGGSGLDSGGSFHLPTLSLTSATNLRVQFGAVITGFSGIVSWEITEHYQ